MSIKIVNRSIIAKQTIFFVLLSSVFLILLEGHFFGSFNFSSVFWKNNYLVLGAGGLVSTLSILSIWLGKKISNILLIILFGIILYKLGFFMLSGGFSKIGLVFFMVYFFSAFIFWNLWKLELQGPVYTNTLSEAFSLKHSGEYNFEIWLEDQNGNRKEGRLVNWDNSSCFIFSNDKEKIKGKVAVNVHFEGHVFRDVGVVASRFEHSLGIRFLRGKKAQPEPSFGSFYDIIQARGYYNRFTESLDA